MSAGIDPSQPKPSPRALGRGGKALVAAIVLILLVIFVIRNSQRVSVDFLVTSGHPRLIWLIVICTLLGGAVGYFLGRPSRARAVTGRVVAPAGMTRQGGSEERGVTGGAARPAAAPGEGLPAPGAEGPP